MVPGLCACNRWVDLQCPHGKVALVRIFYCVRQAPGEASPLVVEQGWWCLRSETTALTTDAVAQMIDALGQQRTVPAESRTLRTVSAYQSTPSPHDEMLAHAREATSTYLTNRIDSWLGGTRLDDQLWASSARFLPGDAAKVAGFVNSTINDAVSGVMEKTLDIAGVPVDLTGILSGITADLVLEPISKPIDEAQKTIEIVGLCIAVVTLQPSLALACAKALIHMEIDALINKTISSLIDSVTSVSSATDEGAYDKAASAISTAERLNEALNILFSPEPGTVDGPGKSPRAVDGPGEIPPAVGGLSSI